MATIRAIATWFDARRRLVALVLSGWVALIVIGAGEVGYHLAKELSNRDHDVIVVDVSRERLERIEEQLDVTTLCGDGAHVDVLRRAEVEECDLLLAVSNND